MSTEPSQILALLDCGRITLSEAEIMLDSAVANRSPFSRVKLWIGSRIGVSLSAALFAGVVLHPIFAAILHAGMQVFGGPDGIHLLLNRLLEAFL